MDFIVIVPIQSGFCESAHQNSRQADRILGRVLTESSQGMVSGNPWKSSMEIPGDFHGISMFWLRVTLENCHVETIKLASFLGTRWN